MSNSTLRLPLNPPPTSYATTNAFGSLRFTDPLAITSPPGETNRLFIVEQPGRVRIYDGSSLLTTSFLDVSSLVSCCTERGLLGLAFHPNYPTNGFFYIYYTNTSGNIVVARYHVSSDANIADPNSALILLTIPHPGQANHNGGSLAFGPDGKLYAGVGDGGGAGDTPNNAQNLSVLLGKILRLARSTRSRLTVSTGVLKSLPSSAAKRCSSTLPEFST